MRSALSGDANHLTTLGMTCTEYSSAVRLLPIFSNGPNTREFAAHQMLLSHPDTLCFT
jgi:hypothetical protein